VNMGHLLGPWLKSFSKQRNLVLIGLAALCWDLWISRNILVFHKSQNKSILQWCLGERSGPGAGLSFLRRMGESFWRKVVGCWRQ
jgi:hypothetical protein